jgi:hypothetical protein
LSGVVVVIDIAAADAAWVTTCKRANDAGIRSIQIDDESAKAIDKYGELRAEVLGS